MTVALIGGPFDGQTMRFTVADLRAYTIDEAFDLLWRDEWHRYTLTTDIELDIEMRAEHVERVGAT